jgi:hypothetical protein
MKKIILILLLLACLPCIVGVKHFKGRKTTITYYVVTGNTDPNCNGNYFEAGIIEGRPYQRREDGAYFIWWHNGIEYWLISDSIPTPIHEWYRNSQDMTGVYIPAFGATGTATVSLGQ